MTLTELGIVNQLALEDNVDAVLEKLEEIRCYLEDDVDLDTVAAAAVAGLAAMLSVVTALRDAGATITDTPEGDEALVTCVVNAHLIQRDMMRELDHLSGLLNRFGQAPS